MIYMCGIEELAVYTVKCYFMVDIKIGILEKMRLNCALFII